MAIKKRCIEQRSIDHARAQKAMDDVSMLIYYAEKRDDRSSWNFGVDVKVKGMPGLVGVRFNRNISGPDSGALMFNCSVNVHGGGKDNIFMKSFSNCTVEELEAVVNAVRKRVVKAREKPFFDLGDSDIRSWFSNLSLSCKKLVFSFYTEDEYGRNAPVHPKVTEENYYRISKESKSDSDLSKGLDSVFCSLNGRCLRDIYYHIAICNKYVAPVRPSEEDIRQFSKVVKEKDYSLHR